MKITPTRQLFLKLWGAFILFCLLAANSGLVVNAKTTGQESDRLPIQNNEPPRIIEGDWISVKMSMNGSPHPFMLSLHAMDNESLTWKISVPPQNGIASASGKGITTELRYTPNTNYTGIDSFMVEVSDGQSTDAIVVDVVILPTSTDSQFEMGEENHFRDSRDNKAVAPPQNKTVTSEISPNTLYGEVLDEGSAYIDVNMNGWWLNGCGWPLGTFVTLTINNPNNGSGIDYVDTALSVEDIPDPNTNVMCYYSNPTKASFNRPSFPLKPGYILTMTGVGISKTLTIKLRVTDYDFVGDKISGIASPGNLIDMWVWDPDAEEYVFHYPSITTDDSGHWSVDWQGIFDIKEDGWGWVYAREADGDWTRYNWNIPNPTIRASLPPGNGMSLANFVSSYEWPLGASILLTIDDPDNGSGIDYSDMEVVYENADYDPYGTFVGFYVGGFDLDNGQRITLTDRKTTRSMIVSNLTITSVNPDANYVRGIESPEQAVTVYACTGSNCEARYPITNTSGYWTANFSIYGSGPGEEIIDIRPGTYGGISSYSDDGNETFIGWLAPKCYTLTITSINGGIVTPLGSQSLSCPSGSYLAGSKVWLTANQSGINIIKSWDGVDASFSNNTAYVIMNGNKTVKANFEKPVIVLVHGILTKPGNFTDVCGSDPKAYHYSGNPNSLSGVDPDLREYFGDLPESLDEKGYDIWIAHVASEPLKLSNGVWIDDTPSLNTNAGCLAKQLEKIGAAKIRLIAHSMGGLVSRACISQNLLGCRDRVASLMTLGSPHAGTWWPAAQTALLDMSYSKIGDFNKSNPNILSKDYMFLGGGWLPTFIFGVGSVLGDVVVSDVSSVGWTNTLGTTNPVNWDTGFCDPTRASCKIKPVRLWTNNAHWDYFNSSSSAMHCIDWFLGMELSKPPGCANAYTYSPPSNSQASLQTTTDNGTQATPIVENTLTSAQNSTHFVPVDAAGKTIFILLWAGGNPELTLIRPDGQMINQAYAIAHPNEVTYSDYPGGDAAFNQKLYTFPSAAAGMWQVSINNNGLEPSHYYTFAQLTSVRTLNVATSADRLLPGDLLNLTATLQNGTTNLVGAVVSAHLRRNDTLTDTIPLIDQGNGIYSSVYAVPDVPGYLHLVVTASGNDGVPFERQIEKTLEVSSPQASLNGMYSGFVLDNDNNGKFESLEIQVGIDTITGGDFTLTGDITSDGQFVAHGSAQAVLTSGTQTLTLHFNGDDVLNSELNGPYTLTNLILVNNDLGLIPIASASNVWTSDVYKAVDFTTMCFTLNLVVDQEIGGTILSDLAPNCGDSQYTTGSVVNLTAIVDSGYTFSHWSGDLSGSTTSASIPLDNDRLVIAHFNVIDSKSPTVLSSVRANLHPTSASTIDFIVTFSEYVTGINTIPPFSNFTLSTAGVTGATITGVRGLDAVYTISVNTGSGNGTIRLDVVDDNIIADVAGNRLGGANIGDGNFITGEAYIIAKTHPVLLSPTEMDATLSLQPTFDWSDVSGSGYYTIQVATNESFVPVLVNEISSESDLKLQQDLPPSTKFYWRVRAEGISGLKGWSETLSFFTPNPPSTPLLISPSANSVTKDYKPLFKWNPILLPRGTEFGHYQLQVSTERDFSTQIIDADISGLTMKMYSPTMDLLPGITYHWRVRAFNAVNEFSSWSEVRSFTTPNLILEGNRPRIFSTDPTIPLPELITPLYGNKVSTLKPILDWTDIPGTTGYVVQVSTNANFAFQGTEVSATTVASEYFFTGNLPAGTTLYWRVLSFQRDRISSWSSIYSFVTP